VSDLEAAIDALYARPLLEFTPARDALAAQLKQNGARDDAARIKSLGKPGVTSWAVNQLHHHERAKLDALFDAVARLREAQRLGSADDFRGAQAARREAMQALVKAAERRLSEAGHAVTPAATQRIARTLDALAAGGWPGGVGAGRLAEDLDPPGFDAFAGAVFETPVPRAPVPETSGKAAARARHEALERAEAEVAEAQDALRQAKKASAQAAAAADMARQEQAQVQEELQRVSQRAREATERAERASFEARRAATALAEAERGVEAARVALDRTRRSL